LYAKFRTNPTDRYNRKRIEKAVQDFSGSVVSAQKACWQGRAETGSMMIVGVLTAHLSMQGVTSLKGKRSIVKSVIGRLKSRFNISISEVDHQDSKTSAVIGISIVSNDTHFIDQQFDAIINFMRNDGRFYLGQIERETFS